MTETIHLTDPRKWVTIHADYLYSYAISRIGNEEQARDLVQDTFLAALEKLDKFEGKSSERTWLTAILKYKIIDVYRKSSSRPASADVQHAERQQEDFFNHEDGHWTNERAPQSFSIDDYDPIVNKEFNSILQKCMQKLPRL